MIGVSDPGGQGEGEGQGEAAGEGRAANSLEALIALDRRHPGRAPRPPQDLELAPLPAGPREAAAQPARTAGSPPPRGLPAQRDRRAAEQRESRPLTASASEAGAAPQGAAGSSAGGPRGAARDPGASGPEAQAALAVGARLHSLLEGHRPGDLASGRFEARARELLADLGRELRPPAQGPALARAQALLEALRRGPLLAKLEGLEPAIVARELPLLAPPQAGDLAPIGPYTGTLDLLYRDGPLWVVADFKTDRIAGDPEAAAQRYGPQLGRYLDALGQALELRPEQVCAELWWLESGEVQRLHVPRSAGPAA